MMKIKYRSIRAIFNFQANFAYRGESIMEETRMSLMRKVKEDRTVIKMP